MQSLENTTFDCDKSIKFTNQIESKFKAFLDGNKLLKNLISYTMLNLDNSSSCSNNCSGHGDCLDNICFCEVSV